MTTFLEWLPLASSTLQPIALDFAINTIGWGFTVLTKAGSKFYDLTGSIAFVITATYSYSRGAETTTLMRQGVATGMIVFWSVRLGAFLFIRILKHGGIDKRVEKHVSNHRRFAIMWFLQGVWVAMNLLPVLTINANAKTLFAPLTIWDSIPLTGYTLGLGLQILADEQKNEFNKHNKGKWINTGIWKYSQHPNYFAEFIIHSSIAIFCAPALWKGTFSQKVVAFSPLFEMLLIRYVSGIPILQRDGMEKWGNQPEYIEYRKSTSLLIPWPYRVTNDLDEVKTTIRGGGGGAGGAGGITKNRSRSRSSKTATMAQRSKRS
jgi:steroid 5-alpha reductase family enzyme